MSKETSLLLACLEILAENNWRGDLQEEIVDCINETRPEGKRIALNN